MSGQERFTDDEIEAAALAVLCVDWKPGAAERLRQARAKHWRTAVERATAALTALVPDQGRPAAEERG